VSEGVRLHFRIYRARPLFSA